MPKDSKAPVVEDVVTTGKSALECSKIVMKNEAKIIGYACIIDRSNNKLLIKDKIISQIKIEIPIFGEDDLPNDLKKIPAIKPGSRDLSNE
jgi:orotate phosphoribosyltransferase